MHKCCMECFSCTSGLVMYTQKRTNFVLCGITQQWKVDFLALLCVVSLFLELVQKMALFSQSHNLSHNITSIPKNELFSQNLHMFTS